MTKFLVYGSKGWIGSQFIEILKNKEIEYQHGNSRVDNVKDVVKEIRDYNPTHVVSFIGRTHGTIGDKKYGTIDYLEQPGKLVDNIRDNLFSPLSLALICKDCDVHLTYLGTGCIFKFDDEHPHGEEINGFTEDSEPNFFESSYSIVKGFTDRLMHLIETNVLNLRIRMPIVGCENPRNFITKITNYEKICNCPNSMTVLPELLPIALDMALKYRTGTINLTNPGLISHNEILDMYKEIVDPNFTYQNFTYEEQMKILASGRSNNYLDTSKLESLYPSVKNIKDSVRECLIQYRDSLETNVCENTVLNLSNLTNNSDNVLLVTGGAGFIGSNFINHIVEDFDKITIINLDALYYCADKNNVKESIRNSDNYIFIKGNVCSTDLVNHILEEYQVTHVVHFAAQSHVQTSFDDSFQYTQDNIVGTHRLLECCRLYKGIKLFIHVSTDEVYGESMLDIGETSKTEHSVLCPTNPYAATKASAEMIAQSYSHSYKMPIIITRGNNVYGPNQYPEKLIPKFIKQLKNRQQVTIQGDGSCVRAFLHSKDTARAFQTILEKGIIGEIYNIGCDDGMEFSVKDIADILIKKIIGIEKEHNTMWIRYIEDRPFNDKRYYISNQKLKDLGWDVRIQLEDGLKDLIQ